MRKHMKSCQILSALSNGVKGIEERKRTEQEIEQNQVLHSIEKTRRSSDRIQERTGNTKKKVRKKMVRMEGLEPSRLAVQTPEACASTNFATFAICDPDESRTHDHRLRKPILYPPELRDHRHHKRQRHYINIIQKYNKKR